MEIRSIKQGDHLLRHLIRYSWSELSEESKSHIRKFFGDTHFVKRIAIVAKAEDFEDDLLRLFLKALSVHPLDCIALVGKQLPYTCLYYFDDVPMHSILLDRLHDKAILIITLYKEDPNGRIDALMDAVFK